MRSSQEIESRRDHRGRDNGFEICGVSEELLTRFSQRSRQRDDAIRAFVEEMGRQPTDNEVAVLVRETRADKLIEISTEEVRRQQRTRVSQEESATLTTLRRDGAEVECIPASAEPSLRHAQNHVFERVSVARDHELLTEALRHGRGHIRIDELKGRMATQEVAGQLLRHDDEVATAESLQRERDMIEAVNRDPAVSELGMGEVIRRFVAEQNFGIATKQRRGGYFREGFSCGWGGDRTLLSKTHERRRRH